VARTPKGLFKSVTGPHGRKLTKGLPTFEKDLDVSDSPLPERPNRCMQSRRAGLGGFTIKCAGESGRVIEVLFGAEEDFAG